MRNIELQKCSKASIRDAVRDIALSGLDIREPGELWLIPMQGKVEVWPGYLGRIKLVRQVPGILDVGLVPVHENDTYEPQGPRALPVHQKPGNFKPRGRMIGAYVFVEWESGRVQVEDMDWATMEKRRNQYARSWQKERSAWKTSPEQMGLITCARAYLHPRNIPGMSRVASALILRQERSMELLREAFPGQELESYEAPEATPASMHAVHGDDDEDNRKVILYEISRSHQTVVYPLTTEIGRQAICHTFFGCKQWQDLSNIHMPQLTQHYGKWRAFVEALQVEGVPDGSDCWTFRQWGDWAWEGVVPETPQDAPESTNGTEGEGQQGDLPLAADSAPVQDAPLISDIEEFHGLVQAHIETIENDTRQKALKKALADWYGATSWASMPSYVRTGNADLGALRFVFEEITRKGLPDAQQYPNLGQWVHDVLSTRASLQQQPALEAPHE